MEYNMLPHQERVILEKKELDDKINKLAKFICTNNAFVDLDKDERESLMKQWNVMKEYSKILNERIMRF